MFNKKAPDAWRRWGRDETGGNQSTCPKYAASNYEAQDRACSACAFYREIPLPSGRHRNFQPGKWIDEGAATASPYPIRQGLVCRRCSNGLVPTIRAALQGIVGCMAGHVVAGAAWPAFCTDFRARGAANVR